MPKRIGIIIDDAKHLPECLSGLKYLAEKEAEGKISLPQGVQIAAAKEAVIRTLTSLEDFVDIWIIGSSRMEIFFVIEDFMSKFSSGKIPVSQVIFGKGENLFPIACQLAACGDWQGLQAEPAPPRQNLDLEEAIKKAEEMSA